jgi:nicotinamidase-related amidase
MISGSETDVCVLATVLDAVDMGYRVIVVRDAVCRSSDEGHDMLMRLYHTRYTQPRMPRLFSRGGTELRFPPVMPPVRAG